MTLTAYPYFSTGPGQIRNVTLPGPDGDFRDISTYIPWSFQENTVPRPINTLVMLDAFYFRIDAAATVAYDSVVCVDRHAFVSVVYDDYVPSSSSTYLCNQ